MRYELSNHMLDNFERTMYGIKFDTAGCPTTSLWECSCQSHYQMLRSVTFTIMFDHSWYGYHLEALAMHNGWAGLVVFLLADPHLLEGGQGGEDRAADPYRVFALGWCDDLDLHRGWSKSCDLLLHAVGDAWEHRAATRQDCVGVQVFTDVHVALHDAVVRRFMDAARLHTQEAWLQHGLWASEPLVADGDHLAVGKLVALLQGRRSSGGGHLLLKVKCDVAQLLLDVTHDFTLGCCCEAVAALGEDLHQVVGEITASQVETQDGVGQGVTLVDGHGVGDTISGVQHNTRCTTRRVQRQHGLDGDVHGWCVEGLEHDLCHLLPVGLRVEGSLGQQDWVFLGGNSQLVVEGVMPDLLHVVPVCDDTMLDGVLQGEDTPLALCLVTNIAVLLSHTDHDTLSTNRQHKISSKYQ